jgi:hypothetical protein
MSRTWKAQGNEFQLDWGPHAWSLRVDGAHPGLYATDLGPLLALDGLAECGRSDPDALSGKSLIGFEYRHGRVEATYAPQGWGSIQVRAAWSPFGEDAVDLEVQLSAQSVGELRRVEVKVVSHWQHKETESREPIARWVEPRDARSAGLSYDGRETNLHGLTTLPPRESAFLTPRLITDGGDAPWLYAEMIHPQDVTRRIREGGRTLGAAKTTRYGLFGYDLEKGVVLRGRLRGVWLRSQSAKEEAFAHFEEFVHEPPPLST